MIRKKGALVEVNSETDFCAKNDEFVHLLKQLQRLAVENDLSDVEHLSNLSIDGKTVEEIRTQLIGKIGENITIRRVKDNSLKEIFFHITMEEE